MAQQGLLANLPRPEALMGASKDSNTLGKALVQLLNNWYLLFQNVVRNTGIWTPQPNGNPIFASDNDQTGTTLAIAGTFTPFGGANFSGLFTVCDATTSGIVGLFLQGGASVALVAQSLAGKYSTTVGNPGTINVYLVANVITVQNNTAAPIEIRVMGLRVRNST